MCKNVVRSLDLVSPDRSLIDLAGFVCRAAAPGWQCTFPFAGWLPIASIRRARSDVGGIEMNKKLQIQQVLHAPPGTRALFHDDRGAPYYEDVSFVALAVDEEGARMVGVDPFADPDEQIVNARGQFVRLCQAVES